jgi:molybdenum cofactor biosynthesis enzyme MoaA
MKTEQEITIEITQYCPNNCFYCSSNADKEGKHLFKETIFEFLKGKEPSRINISGGEPLSHPDFYEILTHCSSICEDVRVYTNAIKHIMFNADILKRVTVSANVILPDVENIHLLKPKQSGRLKEVFNNNSKITLSGCDCNSCNHELLQADGKIVSAPCKKEYI